MARFFRRKGQQVSRKPQKSRLDLQALEDRAVPAAFVVNNSGDNIDASPTVTTLREALTTAATNNEDDTITFDPSITTVNYTAAQQAITEGKSLTITGNGADKLTINAGAFLGFIVNPGSAGSVTSIAGLTITHTGQAVATGSANAPSVTLDQVEIIGSGGNGVLAQSGVMKITNSTITGEGMGVVVTGTGTVATIQNSTIAFNPGSGLITAGTTSTTVQNSTIANNGIGINGSVATAPITISSVIDARNTTDVSATTVFTGNNNNNVVGVGQAAPTGGVSNGSNGNQVGTAATPFDAGLAPFLSSNGGTTRTINLTATSQSLDKGAQNGLTTDQRGTARPATGADVGAVEAGTAAGTGTGTGTSTATSTATATATATGTATGTGTSTSGSSQNAIINQLVIANLQKVFAQPLPPAIALALIVGLQDVNGDGFNDVVSLVGLNVKQNGKNKIMLFRLVFDGLSPSSALIGTPQVLGTF